MKMNLKYHKKIKINFDIFNKKNFFIFLISLFIVGLTTGIIFYIYLNSSDKSKIIENINSYFTIKDSYNYLISLLLSIKNNFLTVLIIWLLGISVIGILFIIFLYFIESFTIGFSIASIIDIYGFKGIFGSLLYLFPSKIIYLIMFFILTYFSIIFSYNLIKSIISKDNIINDKLKKYLKVLGFSLIISSLCSLLEVFITPLMVKIFTNLIK